MATGHWQSKMVVRRTDKLFSEFIRRRDGVCQYRTQCYGEPRNWKELDCSHYHGRGKESVRFDPQNADGICKKCHHYVHTAEGQQWLDVWKENQLGERDFNLLLLRANTPQKRDDVMDNLNIRILLDGLV